ncbi:MAG: hypothetical protein JWO80_4356 [Bryobacterales bacterium]|nr:hypothetical protein [Bryobacterales bacterium]
MILDCVLFDKGTHDVLGNSRREEPVERAVAMYLNYVGGPLCKPYQYDRATCALSAKRDAEPPAGLGSYRKARKRADIRVVQETLGPRRISTTELNTRVLINLVKQLYRVTNPAENLNYAPAHADPDELDLS